MRLLIVLSLIAIFLLFLVWLTQVPTEEEYRKEYAEFITKTFKGSTSYKEIELNKPLRLSSRSQLVVFGVDHTKILGTSWALYMVTQENDYNIVSPTKHDNFWCQRISSIPTKDCVTMKEAFELQEVVWSNKKYLKARAFIVTK